jgi:hypothetical protein
MLLLYIVYNISVYVYIYKYIYMYNMYRVIEHVS